MLEKKKEKGIKIMELTCWKTHLDDRLWRLFSLISLNENIIFSTNKQKWKRIETVGLLSLVLMRYKNCLFQEEDFDLPTFAMPAAPWDTIDWIVDRVDFFCSNFQEDCFLLHFFLFFARRLITANVGLNKRLIED